MHAFSIMNNTPLHFLVAGITLIVFLAAVFSKDQLKKTLTFALQLLFGLVLISGLYVWTLTPISWAVVVKSLGGVVLMWTMLQIIKTPSRTPYWVLFVGVAGVGLSLAFFWI